MLMRFVGPVFLATCLASTCLAQTSVTETSENATTVGEAVPKFESAKTVEEFLSAEVKVNEFLAEELPKLSQRINDVRSLKPDSPLERLLEARPLFLNRADSLEREFEARLRAIRLLSSLAFAEQNKEVKARLIALLEGYSEYQRLSAILRDELRRVVALTDIVPPPMPRRSTAPTSEKSLEQVRAELTQVQYILAQRYQEPAYKQLVQQHRVRVAQFLAMHKQDAQLAREYIAILKNEIPLVDLGQMVAGTSSSLEQQLAAAEGRWVKLHGNSQGKMAAALAERRAAFRRLAEIAEKARVDAREKFVEAATASGTVQRPAFENSWVKSEEGDEEGSKKQGNASASAGSDGEGDALSSIVGEDEDLMMIFKIAMLVAA